MKKILKPFYFGKVSYYESCMFISSEKEKQLLFDISKVKGVYTYGLEKKFKKGIDYKIKDGKLVRLENGSMPFISHSDYYRDTPDSIEIKHNSGKYLMFGESDTFIKNQICITYKHNDKWNGYIPHEQSYKFVSLFDKARNKKKLNLVFFGDSITYGCNASGMDVGGNRAPYMDCWAKLVSNKVQEMLHTGVNYINTAVGGMTTQWGVDNFEERVNKFNPDLVVIGFGMNDPNLTNDEYLNKIMTIVNGVRNKNPDCEFIIIGSILPNVETNWNDGNQKNYHEVINSIDLPYVGTVDMTSLHYDILKRKSYKDMTGNNVNHPNDYLIRLYAQSILTTIFGKYKY